MAFINKSRR